MSRTIIISAFCAALMAAQLGTAQASDPSAAAATSASAGSTEDLKQLRERLTQQEEQIKRLQKAVDEQQRLLEKSLAAAQPAATGTAQPESSSAGSHGTEPVASQSEGPKLVPVVGGVTPLVKGASRGGQREAANKTSPLSISIGDTTFTPLGFVDATFFGRSTNVGSGIGTNFGNIPYNTSATGHLSEMNFSTQNSRIGFRVDSKVLGAKVLGYFEADFLGNQNANIFVSSNADTFRMRNVFVDVQKDGFEILGGQDWSMMTPNRKGLSPLPSDIFFTQNMDTNYQAGLVWSRQTQFRFIAHPNENVAFGVSLENPEQYVGGANGSPTPVFPKAFMTLANGQFNNGSTNYSAPNLHPDIVFKGAYDGHVGEKIMHVEAAALVRSFKFAYPVGTPVKYTTSSATAVSGSVNANLEVAKGFRIIANTFFGSGNGRYAFGQAPDVIIRADGGISPIHTYSTVDGFEATIKKNFLLYAYYGGILVGRNNGFDSDGVTPIGYGVPSTSGTPNPNQNRAIQEGTLGVVQTFWKSPSYGALSLITQYSYLTRNPWALSSTAPRATHTNMYWVNLRYTLP